MSTCPACTAPQTDGLLCHTDTTRLEHTLRSIPELVHELDVTLSRQARIGTTGRAGKGSAHEKTPVHLGALQASSDLCTTLAAWVIDIRGEDYPLSGGAAELAAVLFYGIDDVRKHPEVAKLLDEITDATNQARHVIDKPAERVFVGPCLYEDAGTTCHADLYAKPDSAYVTCRQCETTHEVAERRAWLLQEASERLFTVREAARMVGKVGDIKVTESSIRGLIHRKRLAYRPGTNTIRLGDLLELLTTRATTAVAS